MSKRGISLLVVAIILASIFSILPANAIGENSIQDAAEKASDIADKSSNIVNTIADPNSRVEFLKKKWGEFVDSTPIGVAINATNKVIQPLNPLIKIAIGTPFAWDWLFWITFAIWILAFSAFRKTLLLKLALKLKLYSRGLRLIVAIIVTSLVGFTTIYYQISKYILILTYKIPSLFLQVVINIAIFVTIIWFSASIGMNKKDLDNLIREEKQFNELRRLAKQQAKDKAEADEKAKEQKKETDELKEEVEGEEKKKLTPEEKALKKERIKKGLKIAEEIGKVAEKSEEEIQKELEKTKLKSPESLKKPKDLY